MYKVVLEQEKFGALELIECLCEELKLVKTGGGTSLWMLGGHIPKVGCSTYIARLYRGGYISHVAMNGACAIHDFELCVLGKTSEDVWSQDFGMKEDSERIYKLMLDTDGFPLGISLRHKLKVLSDTFGPKQMRYYANDSVLANTASTVHSFLQIDMQSVWATEATAKEHSIASWKDYTRLTQVVARIANGMVVNVGSAVQMPGIFLKATARAKRMGFPFDNNYSAYNLDMIQHYNANRLHPKNVTRITGYHEVLLPLICQKLGV